MEQAGGISGRISEIRDLTDAFNHMTRQMKQMFAGLNREIGERKKTEKKYQTLVENLTEIVYTLDTQGNFTYVSPSIKELSGYAPEEVVGRNFIEFVRPEDIGGRREHYQTLTGGVADSAENRLLRKDGRSVWIKTCSRPVIENGSITGLQGVLTDISELKSAEAQIRQLEKAESLDRMAGAVAHHYNNQLSAVMGSLELALIQADETDQADLAGVLNNAMKAVLRLRAWGMRCSLCWATKPSSFSSWTWWRPAGNFWPIFRSGCLKRYRCEDTCPNQAFRSWPMPKKCESYWNIWCRMLGKPWRINLDRSG